MLPLLLIVFYRLVALVLSISDQQRSDDKPRLVFSVFRKDIHIVNLERLNNTIGYAETDLFMNTTGVSINISEIDYSLDGNILVWRMCEPINTIYAAPIDNRKKNMLNIADYSVLLNLNKTTSTRVSIDWIHNLIYFNEMNQILVTNITNPKHAYTVANEPTDRVLDIAVNPLVSLLVWSVSDPKYMNGKIKTSQQDGSEPKVIVKDMAKEPITLAIDYAVDKIYWIDRLLFSVSSVNYDGSDRKMVYQSNKLLTLTYFMDIYGDNIYWSSYMFKGIIKASKSGSDNSTSFLVTADTDIEGIRVIDRSRQPRAPNRCRFSQCSYLCLPLRSQTYRCVCPKQMYYGYNHSDLCTESVHQQTVVTTTQSTTTYKFTTNKFNNNSWGKTPATIQTTARSVFDVITNLSVFSSSANNGLESSDHRTQYNASAMSDRNCIYVINYKTSIWLYLVIIVSLMFNICAICGYLYILRNRKRKLAAKLSEANVMRVFRQSRCDARHIGDTSYLTQSNPLISLELIENELYWEVEPKRNKLDDNGATHKLILN